MDSSHRLQVMNLTGPSLRHVVLWLPLGAFPRWLSPSIETVWTIVPTAKKRAMTRIEITALTALLIPYLFCKVQSFRENSPRETQKPLQERWAGSG